MIFIYLIFNQIWEFVLPFCLQRLALLSMCECFFCFNSQEISSLQGLEAWLLSLSEFEKLKPWLLSPSVSPATHSREEQMMAKHSEQPNNNWKDLLVLIWQKAASFLGTMVYNMSMDVIIQLLNIGANCLYYHLLNGKGWELYAKEGLSIENVLRWVASTQELSLPSPAVTVSVWRHMEMWHNFQSSHGRFQIIESKSVA